MRLMSSYWLSSPHPLALSTASRPGILAAAELARGPGPEDVEHEGEVRGREEKLTKA